MPSTDDTPKPTSHAVSRRDPILTSEALFGGSQRIEIHHRGEIYRLQITRQGKLILTK